MMNSSTLSPVWKKLPDLPDREGFAGSYAGVAGGALLVAGGSNFPEKPLWEGGAKIWTDKVFALESPGEEWKEVGTLPGPYGYGASVTVPEGVVCLGGCDAQGHRREVYLLGYEGGILQCRSLAELPRPMANGGAAVWNNRIYLLGGSELPGEQDALAVMYSLDWTREGEVWREEPSLPGRGRFLFGVGVGDNGFYVMGGIGLRPGDGGRMQRDLLPEAWLYSSEGGWVRLQDLPRFCAAAPTPVPVSQSGKIYLLGGDDGSRAGFTPLQEHPGFNPVSLVYDIVSGEWQEGEAVPVARAVLPCCLWEGKAIIVNGEQRPGKRSNEVWSVELP